MVQETGPKEGRPLAGGCNSAGQTAGALALWGEAGGPVCHSTTGDASCLTALGSIALAPGRVGDDWAASAGAVVLLCHTPEEGPNPLLPKPCPFLPGLHVLPLPHRGGATG